MITAFVTLGQVIRLTDYQVGDMYARRGHENEVQKHESEYMGTLKPHDHAVEVRKFEPVQFGSSRFTLTSKVFPDFYRGHTRRPQ